MATPKKQRNTAKPAAARRPAPKKPQAPTPPAKRKGTPRPGARPPPPPLGNQRAKGNRGGKGQESKYTPQACVTVRRLMQLGGTRQEAAEACGIAHGTLIAWELAHPEFAEAMASWQEHANESCKRKLWERAMGYSHPATKIMQNKGVPVVVPYIEHVPPDVGALQYWLNNRDPAHWKSKVEVEGNPDKPVQFNVTIGGAARQVRG